MTYSQQGCREDRNLKAKEQNELPQPASRKELLQLTTKAAQKIRETERVRTNGRQKRRIHPFSRLSW
jgi:hypothetical protein